MQFDAYAQFADADEWPPLWPAAGLDSTSTACWPVSAYAALLPQAAAAVLLYADQEHQGAVAEEPGLEPCQWL